MSWVDGRFFDGRSATAHPVQLYIGMDRLVRVKGLDRRYEQSLDHVEVSPRIGNTPRVLRFSDGATVEVADNDAVDAALESVGVAPAERHVHWLESRWKYALLAAVFAVVLVWAGIEYGIPALAKRVAYWMPAEVDRSLGEESIGVLDDLLFEPSQLPEARRAQLTRDFDAMTRSIEDEHSFRLEFRAAPEVGANAFALPSGIVVLTDELVELAGPDEELKAVLAHEIGHVVQRHSLRMLLQDSAVSLVLMSITGDVTSTSALLAGAPTVLISARHSRQFETEADDFAYGWMERNGVPRHHFAAILQKLDEASGSEDVGWLSSHPRTAERLRPEN